jgi:hypothetical protein
MRCQASQLAGGIVHDFRRSAVRDLVRSGVAEQVAMRFTGHKTRSVFDRHHIVSQRDIREGVERREEMLERERVGPRSAPFAETRPPEGPGGRAKVN